MDHDDDDQESDNGFRGFDSGARYRDQADMANDDDSDEDTSSDEEEDTRATKTSRVTLKELVENVLQDIKQEKLDLTQPDRLATFVTRDGEDMTQTTGEKGAPTALHLILKLLSGDDQTNIPGMDNPSFKVLIQFLSSHPSRLLETQDKDSYMTPLLRAVEGKQETMVEWMCQAAGNRISSILSLTNVKKENCLHVAVQKRLKMLKKLVGLAGEQALAAKNSKGNTPLHLAVEYKACRKDQLSVIQELIKKGDVAIKATPNGDFNNDNLSPYLHHKKTCERALEKKTNSQMSATKLIAGPNTNNHRQGPESYGTGRRGAQAEPPSGLSAAVAPGLDKTQQMTSSNAALHARSGGALTSGSLDLGVAVSSPVVNGAPGNDHADGKGSSNPPETNKTKTKSKISSKVDEAVVKKVEQLLKLHYLRSRSDEACMDILYGKSVTSDLEFYFDLSGRTSMTGRGFGTLLEQLRFEDVLQYVAIPQIRIKPESSPGVGAVPGAHRGTVRNQAHGRNGSGRRDFVQIFEGLRKKGVRTILKVIVDDTLAPPHSDETIEEALRNMDVEVWDWKRIDLCSEVIYTAAPRVREVHLYWGGNNAVLVGWSEENGLKRLRELETVCLHIQAGSLESSQRMRRNVENFVDRMNKTCPKVTVTTEGPINTKQHMLTNGGARGDGGKDDRATKDEWFLYMKNFRQLLFDAERNTNKQVAIEEPIKVALIDDGVDGMQLDEYPLLGGRTFCTRDEARNLNHPYYASGRGHGTVMAKQIYLMCPRAQLYVLRLEDHPSDDGERLINARSAARAIRAAVRKGVHIISMSWTIDPPEDDEVKQELDKAILAAVKANILMFCSASDKGANQNETYPSKATNAIFKIGAASASGAPNQWVNINNVTFIFPGTTKVDVDADGRGSTKDVSGSSVATALAAGLGALILYCAQVRVFTADSAQDRMESKKAFDALKKYDNMYKAFKGIGTTDEKFIKVWEVFGKVHDEKESMDAQKWLDLIAKAATLICLRI